MVLLWKSLWRCALGAVSAAVLLLACSREAPHKEPSRAESVSLNVQSDACRANASTPQFRKALCSGDVVDMLLAIDEVLRKEDQGVNDSMIRLLERLWRRDPTLGDQLPWEQLGNDEMKLIIAEQLAQPIRSGRSGLSLNELRDLALRQAIGGRGDRTSAIRLLGLADVKDQTPFLNNVIETSASTSERYAAIQALGMMCDVEANQVLEHLASHPALNPAESSAVAESLRRRETWVRDLCTRTGRAQ